MGRRTVVMGFKKLHKDAKMPTYGTKGAACMDVSVIEDYCIRPGEVKVMRTGISFEIPDGYVDGFILEYTIDLPNSTG